MSTPFEGVDLSDLWKGDSAGSQLYSEEPPTDAQVAEVERELGYKLPESYIWLMKQHNGGLLKKCCIATEFPIGPGSDHLEVSGLFAIGRTKPFSLCGKLGAAHMQREWGYPAGTIAFADTPTGGHDMIMFDYRDLQPGQEPPVIHAEIGYENVAYTDPLAETFEAFIRLLLPAELFDTSALDLQEDLERIETGAFSHLLADVIAGCKLPETAQAIREISLQGTKQRGRFTLDNDDFTRTLFDIVFWAYTRSRAAFSEADSKAIIWRLLMDGEFRAGGLDGHILREWFHEHINRGEINYLNENTWHFSAPFEAKICEKIHLLANGPHD